MYCNEYRDYHFFLALNIFNIVSSTEIYSGINALLPITSFEHGQLNGHSSRMKVSLIFLYKPIELFCSDKGYTFMHLVINDGQLFRIFFFLKDMEHRLF